MTDTINDYENRRDCSRSHDLTGSTSGIASQMLTDGHTLGEVSKETGLMMYQVLAIARANIDAKRENK